MIKLTERVLLGFAMCATLVYLAVHSNILDYLEGTNVDGSNSITWRSGSALLVLIALCLSLSFWSFRRGFALVLLVGFIACFASSYVLFNSALAFAWEKHGINGTYPLTWKSDLIIFSLLSICLLLSSFALRGTRRFLELGPDRSRS